jgi:hypothetical protein
MPVVVLVWLPLLSACGDQSRATMPEPPERRNAVVATEVQRASPASAAMSLTLPFFGGVNSPTAAFHVEQLGQGNAGFFTIYNTSGSGRALVAGSNGTGETLFARNTGTGTAAYVDILSPSSPATALYVYTNGLGSAGRFYINQQSSSAHVVYAHTNGSGDALSAQASGNGVGVHGINGGRGWAGYFENTPANNGKPALEATTAGTGPAGMFRVTNAARAGNAVEIITVGTGNVLLLNHRGSNGSGNLAILQSNSVNQARISRSGVGYFNGGTQNSGADVAEAFEVEGSVKGYAPGDVLVISETSDRKVEKSGEAYSTRVIGVYATKPGVLLTERDIDASLADMVPVGVLGVLPTKVSAEGGAIRRGDLLVAAGAPGHAMRADPRRLRFGMVLGKALEAFPGPGTGVIRVLVNVK